LIAAAARDKRIDCHPLPSGDFGCRFSRRNNGSSRLMAYGLREIEHVRAYSPGPEVVDVRTADPNRTDAYDHVIGTRKLRLARVPDFQASNSGQICSLHEVSQ
jgi:hypothetical protein